MAAGPDHRGRRGMPAEPPRRRRRRRPTGFPNRQTDRQHGVSAQPLTGHIDTPEQSFRREPAQAGRVLIHHGNCGHQGLGHWKISETDQPDIGAAHALQSRHYPDRTPGIRRKHSGRPVLRGQQGLHGLGGVVADRRTDTDQGRIHRQPMVGQRSGVALQPPSSGGYPRRVAQERDLAVPVVDQVGDRRPGTSEIVLHHTVCRDPLWFPVDEDHRRPVLPGGQIGLVAGHRDADQTDDLPTQQRLHSWPLVGRIVPETGHDHAPSLAPWRNVPQPGSPRRRTGRRCPERPARSLPRGRSAANGPPGWAHTPVPRWPPEPVAGQPQWTYLSPRITRETVVTLTSAARGYITQGAHRRRPFSDLDRATVG